MRLVAQNRCKTLKTMLQVWPWGKSVTNLVRLPMSSMFASEQFEPEHTIVAVRQGLKVVRCVWKVNSFCDPNASSSVLFF
jgi:hypothetical protein